MCIRACTLSSSVTVPNTHIFKKNNNKNSYCMACVHRGFWLKHRCHHDHYSSMSCYPQPRPWAHLMPPIDVSLLPRLFRCLELTCGLSTGRYALINILGEDNVEHTGGYDIDLCLKGFLENKFSPNTYHLGEEGDILRLDSAGVRALPPSDILLFSPPCTPWTKNGDQLGDEDDAARVLDKCIEILIDMSQRGLVCYQMEEVTQLMDRVNGLEPKIYSVLRKLNKDIPHFKHDFDLVNAASSAHARQRLTMRGVRRDVVMSADIPAPLSLPAVDLWDVVNRDLPRSDPVSAKWTQTMVDNLPDCKAVVSKKVREASGHTGILAAANISRKLKGVYGCDARVDGLSLTLQRHNNRIMLMSTADTEAPDSQRQFFRELTPAERLPLVGLCATDACHFSSGAAILNATGNAAPVAMLACGLQPMLKLVIRSCVITRNWAKDSLGAWCRFHPLEVAVYERARRVSKKASSGPPPQKKHRVGDTYFGQCR